MSINIICAFNKQTRAIGLANKLPWHIPGDLKRFKAMTLGYPMIMGRKTWESLPGILPGRPHIVLTRDKNYKASKGCIVAHTRETAISIANSYGEEIFIIGGQQIFEMFLPTAINLFLTEVTTETSGDVFFPDIPDCFEEVGRSALLKEDSATSYRFVNYEFNKC